MSRPPFEVADIIRISGDSFRHRYSASLTWPQRKVLDAIARCRTAALGGHRDACVSCGHLAISYNSCRNRHCPKCQTGARDRWLAKRQQELLAVGYYHLVFSVPHDACAVDVAEQAATLFLAVRSQCRHAARGRCRSEASRRTAWLPVRSAHLGTDAHSASAHPLRGAWWRTRAGPFALDRFPFQLPATGQGAQPRLPRQVPCRTAAPLCPRSVALLRRVHAAS